MSTLWALWQVSGVFQTYLVWDAILKENSWELWATILLGLAMVATRVVAGIIRKDVTDSHAVALRNVGWAVLVTQSLTMVRFLRLLEAVTVLVVYTSAQRLRIRQP